MRQTESVPYDELPPLLKGAEPVHTRDELAVLTDWNDYTIRLLAYARLKLWRHGAAAARFALQPHDLVHEVVELWLENRRIFESGTQGAFFAFLCSVIDSLLSHDKEKTFRHGRQVSISKEGGDENSDEMNEGRIRAGGDFERDFLFRDNLERFIGSLAAYARLLAAAPDSSAEERAHALGITVTEVRNLDRRLHRRGRQWMKQRST
jgi:DNA-directed RNA polymerase specialized sigma24 family protein